MKKKFTFLIIFFISTQLAKSEDLTKNKFLCYNYLNLKPKSHSYITLNFISKNQVVKQEMRNFYIRSEDQLSYKVYPDKVKLSNKAWINRETIFYNYKLDEYNTIRYVCSILDEDTNIRETLIEKLNETLLKQDKLNKF